MKPQPVPITIVCSECGLPWDAHGEQPTKDDCIRLLKAELAKRPEWKYSYTLGGSQLSQISTGGINNLALYSVDEIRNIEKRDDPPDDGVSAKVG